MEGRVKGRDIYYQAPARFPLLRIVATAVGAPTSARSMRRVSASLRALPCPPRPQVQPRAPLGDEK